MGIFSDIWHFLTDWLKPKQKTQGFTLEKEGTNKPIPVIYGEYSKAPCIKVFKATTDKKGGAKNEYLHLVCVFCEGEIEQIGTIYFNGISEHAIPNERYYIERYIGTDTQAASNTLSAEYPAWKATATLSGKAYIYIRLKLDKKGKWWQGEPEITADIKGKKVFDPRTNTTAYSNNPALCLYDYLTNSRYGKGLTPAQIDLEAIKAEANNNEVERTYTRTVTRRYFDPETRTWETEYQGTQNETVVEHLFSCNAKIDTSEKVKDNIETLCQGMRAILPEANGVHRLLVEKAGTPVYAFTKENLVGKISIKGAGLSERYNQVVVKYRNRLTGEDDEVYYPQDDALHQQWLTEDNGKPLKGEYTFDTINNKAEALQMATVIALRSRNQLTVKFTGTPETFVVEVGDIVSLDSQIAGFNAKPFRIQHVSLDMETGQVAFQAIEHQNTIYPWSVTDVTEEYTDTSFNIPTDISVPTGLAYTELTLDDPIQGYLSWHDPNDLMVTSWLVEIYASAALIYSTETNTNRVDLTTLQKGTYTFKVYAQNSIYRTSPAVKGFTVTLAPIGSRYTWKAYADDINGAGISLNPAGKKYIGFAVNQDQSTPSLTNPAIFDWSKFVGEDGQTPQKGVDYFDGKDGIDGTPGSFTSFIFRNAPVLPETPTGGSFNGTSETMPTNWTDNPTAPPAGWVTYVSKRVYSNNGTSWTASAWSTPAPFYERGQDGVSPPRPPGTFKREVITLAWSDSEALQAIRDKLGATESAVTGDTVTLYNLEDLVMPTGFGYSRGWTQTRTYNGSNWVTSRQYLDFGGIVNPPKPIEMLTGFNDLKTLENNRAQKGDNLVVNGDGSHGDNFNFPDFTFDSLVKNGGIGSFKTVDSNTGMHYSEEMIPVDIKQKYELSIDIKASNTSAKYYTGLLSYDVDGLLIDATKVMYINGSLTTLAADLNNGDTVIQLTDASGFDKNTSLNSRKCILFWDYTNSKGYTYPPETYSRNRSVQDLWVNSSSFNGNTITLSSPWTGGYKPAGTKLSQANAGGSHIYNLLSGQTLPNTDWNSYTNVISGANSDGESNDVTLFRHGTAFVRVFGYFNYAGSGGTTTTWIQNVTLKKWVETPDGAQLKADAAQAAAEAAAQAKADAAELAAKQQEQNNRITIVTDPVEGRLSYIKGVGGATNYYDVFSATERTKLDWLRQGKTPDGIRAINDWRDIYGAGRPADYADITNYNDSRVNNSRLTLDVTGHLTWNDDSGAVNLGVVTATGIGAETPTGAQNKADIARQGALADVRKNPQFTNNLLDVSSWIIGTNGSQGRFSQNGSTIENKIINGISPYGYNEPLWECVSDGSNDNDGGWNYTFNNNDGFDHAKSYRFSVWVKQQDARSSIYFGCGPWLTSNLDGTTNQNPYFIVGVDMPTPNKWYLLVGILHGSWYTGSEVGISGIYDPDTGAKISDGLEFKSRVGYYTQTHRAYQFYSQVAGLKTWFARPRVDELNGNEPTLLSLMGDKALLNSNTTPADIGYIGDLDATKGATWGTNINNRPIELIDGRVAAGLRNDGRLANQRKIPMISTVGVNATLSSNPLSAVDAGSTATINIAQHTIYLPDGNLTYNAGSISGLSFSTKYYVYCDDDYTGGAVTYYASTNAAAIVGSLDRRYIGAITTPSNGGGGTPPDDPYCVDPDMWLTDALQARDARVGDLIDVWRNGDSYQQEPITAIRYSDAPVVVYQLTTELGAKVVVSATTPIELRHGKIIYPAYAMGHQLAVIDQRGQLNWQVVTGVECLGERSVVLLSVNNGSYAAGTAPTQRIITHNIMFKP